MQKARDTDVQMHLDNQSVTIDEYQLLSVQMQLKSLSKKILIYEPTETDGPADKRVKPTYRSSNSGAYRLRNFDLNGYGVLAANLSVLSTLDKFLDPGKCS